MLLSTQSPSSTIRATEGVFVPGFLMSSASVGFNGAFLEGKASMSSANGHTIVFSE